MADITAALEEFCRFSPGPSSRVRVFHAPGRVNLIGEHLDYNGGPVLPAAISLGVWLFARERRDGLSRFASQAFPGVAETLVADVAPARRGDFADYPQGVYQTFGQQLGRPLPSLDLYYAGDLPSGAGLASSAAVEVATAMALDAFGGLGLSPRELAALAQRAENDFVGVPCGIMDQFAVSLAQPGHAILLDTATLGYVHVPMRPGGLCFVIAHTGKARELGGTKYHDRRRECQEALALVQTLNPGIRQLADLAEGGDAVERRLEDPVLRRRVHHVRTEARRVYAAAAALRQGSGETFGELMNQSHMSLRDDFEVTGVELDALVEAAWGAESCLGSRMTGAGFGGCTVSLVQRDALPEFFRQVTEGYSRATGIVPTFHVTDLAAGAREVTEEVLAGL